MRQCSRLTFWGGGGGGIRRGVPPPRPKARGGGADFFGLFSLGRGGIDEVALSEGGTNDLAIT
jgi:hypothetical protein